MACRYPPPSSGATHVRSIQTGHAVATAPLARPDIIFIEPGEGASLAKCRKHSRNRLERQSATDFTHRSNRESTAVDRGLCRLVRDNSETFRLRSLRMIRTRHRTWNPGYPSARSMPRDHATLHPTAQNGNGPARARARGCVTGSLELVRFHRTPTTDLFATRPASRNAWLRYTCSTPAMM